MLSKPSVWILL